MQDPPKSQNLQKSLFSGLLQRVEFATKYSLLVSLFSNAPQEAPRSLQERSSSPQELRNHREMSKEKSKTNTLTSSQKTTHNTKQRGAARDERSEDLESEVRLATGQPQTAGNRRQREITTTKANVRRQRSLPNPEDGRVALRWTPKRPEVPEQPHVQSCHTSV